MDISKITKGMVIKSYKEMCDRLGIRYASGNTKISQMKEMERYFTYKKDGNKFIITEVFSKPKKKKANKKNNAYGELVQILLADYLIKTNEKILVRSGQRLMREVGLVNQRYKTNKENFNDYTISSNIDRDVILDFFDTTDATFSSAIRSALKGLEQRSVVMFSEDYIVKELGSAEHRLSTPKEIQKIMQIRRKLLDEMNYSSLRKVLFSSDQYRYKEEWSKRLQAEMGLEFVYKGYIINVLKTALPEQQLRLIEEISSSEKIESLLTESQQDNFITELNSTVVIRLLQNAEKRAERAIKEMEETKVKMAFGEDKITLKGKKLARTHENYVSNVDRIIEDNIKLKKEKENKEENKKDKK